MLAGINQNDEGDAVRVSFVCKHGDIAAAGACPAMLQVCIVGSVDADWRGRAVITRWHQAESCKVLGVLASNTGGITTETHMANRPRSPEWLVLLIPIDTQDLAAPSSPLYLVYVVYVLVHASLRIWKASPHLQA